MSNKSRRKQWRQRGLALAVGLVIALAAAEGAVRLAAWAQRRDALGPPPGGSAGPILYCIGDSFTFGLRVKPEEAWPKVLERMLQRDLRTARVVNFANPGLSSANVVYGVARVLERGDALAIFVLAGWNANDTDFAQHAAERDRPVPFTARAENLLESSSRLYRLVKQALTYRDRAAVLGAIKLAPQTTMDLYEFRAYQEIADKNLRRVAGLCRQFGVPLVLMNYPFRDLPPNPYSKNEYYHVVYGRTKVTEADYLVRDRQPDEIAIHAVIRKVGEEEGVPVVDFQEAFVRSGRGIEELFQPDWHHPTPVGHEIMAQAVYGKLGGELRARMRAAAAGRP
jgi:lysophospholipase L1-like esterase